MKRINSIFFAAAAAALSLVSCSQEDLAPVQKPQGELVAVHFGAESGIASSTKATLTTEDEETFNSAWDNGDVLSVEYTNDNYESDVVDATWESSSSSFLATLPECKGEWVYYAVYPTPTSDGTIDFGSSRIQNGNNYNSTYDLMKGSADAKNAEAGKDDDGKDIVFKMDRQTAIAYFHLTSELDEEVVSATLSVEGEVAAIASSVVMPLDYSKGFDLSTKDLKSITITYEDGTAPKANDFQLWFNVLPTVYDKMTLTVETTGHTMSISRTSKEDSYEAGKLYKVFKTIPTDKWVEKKISGLTFDFSSKITDWPTSKSDAKDGSYSYTLEGKTYSFVHEGGVYCGGISSPYYLMISKGGRLGLPAIAGYKLSKVVCTNTSGASQQTKVSIEDVDGVTVSGGDVILWGKRSSTYTYNLSGTHENIVYYMDVTSDGNCQLLTLVLDYEPAAPAYSIALSDLDGGDVTVDSRLAEAGSEVSLTATPKTGYEFKDWDVKDSDGASVVVSADGKFTMPAKDVKVSAVFTKVEYKIVKENAEHGSFTVKVNGEEATIANYGDVVTLEATSDEGYSFDKWTVMDDSKKAVSVSSNKFTMPAANVSVSATFIQSTFASLEALVEAGKPTTAGRNVTVTLSDEIIASFKNSYFGVNINVATANGNPQKVVVYCSGRPTDWTVNGMLSGTLKDCKWSYTSSEWRLSPNDYNELTYTPAPVINCVDANVTAGETQYKLAYSIDNSLEGAAVSLGDVDGTVVTNAIINEATSTVACTLASNTTTSTRKGSVTIKYAHVSKVISITQEANTLSVDQKTKTWASDATDEFVIKVNVNNGASWTVSPETLEWATITTDKEAGTIKVKPNGANNSGAAYSATLKVTHTTATALTETITLKQLQTGAVESKQVTFTFKNITKSSSEFTVDGVSFKGEKGTGTTPARTWDNGLRVYAGNKITISVADGHLITKIEFSSSISTWTGSANSVVFDKLSKATIETMTVTYE